MTEDGYDGHIARRLDEHNVWKFLARANNKIGKCTLLTNGLTTVQEDMQVLNSDDKITENCKEWHQACSQEFF